MQENEKNVNWKRKIVFVEKTSITIDKIEYENFEKIITFMPLQTLTVLNTQFLLNRSN